MGRQAPMQSNFTAGEFSPRLLARHDIEKYKNAVKTLTNFKTFPHGGATKRGGTKFSARVKDSTKLARLIEFIFSTDQAYCMEFGYKYVRAHTSAGIPLADGPHLSGVTGINWLDFWTKTLSGAGTAEWLAPGIARESIEIYTGTGAGHYGGMRIEASLPPVTQRLSYTLDYDPIFSGVSTTIKVGTSPGASDLVNQSRLGDGNYTDDFTPTTSRTYIEIRVAYTAAEERVRVSQVNVQNATQAEWEIGSPYLDTQLAKLKKAQSADVMYLVHPNVRPYKLMRFSQTHWEMRPVEFIDGPYLDENLTVTTITPSGTAVGTSITLTASDHLFEEPAGGSLHVGSIWRIRHGGTTGYVKITAVTDTKTATATVMKALGATTATATWSEGAWSDYRGWPSAIAFYEERLWFAGTTYQPTHLWGSVTGDFENMTPGTAADDAIVYEIREDQVNSIRWLRAGTFLFAGTPAGEHRIGQKDVTITPTNIKVNPQHGHGSADVEPVKIGSALIFLQRAGRKLRELLGIEQPYDAESEEAADLTIFAEHITKPSLTEICYQQEPDSVVWGVRSDGKLLGMTYQRREKVVGWHRHETDGVVESQCVIPVSDGDQHWWLVRRTIGGTDYRSVEVAQREYQDGDSQADAWYVDCGVKQTGAASTITGLSHLEGKTVAILADGAVHPQKVVAGGSVTLDYSASTRIAGLPYTATLVTLPPPVMIAIGNAHARLKRWAQVFVRLYNTMGLKVGTGAQQREVAFRSTEHDMDEPPPLLSDIVEVPQLGYSKDAPITFTHDWPTPCTITAITGTLDVGDE